MGGCEGSEISSESGNEHLGRLETGVCGVVWFKAENLLGSLCLPLGAVVVDWVGTFEEVDS